MERNSTAGGSGSGHSGSLERTGLTSLEPELYNQLRGLQKSARELRQVVRGMGWLEFESRRQPYSENQEMAV